MSNPSSASEAESPASLRAVGLGKSYGKREVLRDVSIEVHPGEVVGLLGPNGAGKTTTFYCIVGLTRPDAGAVHFGGEDLTEMPMYQRARHGISYLPQEPSVFRGLSVEDNIRAVLETLPLSREDRRARLSSLLDELSIGHLAKSKASALSGGERRRLEITRALVLSPAFILLDEPFAGVDPINVHEIQELVEKMRDKGIGILITDHNVRETLQTTDRSYIIHAGKILREGDAEFLVKDAAVREVYLGRNFDVPITGGVSSAEADALISDEGE